MKAHIHAFYTGPSHFLYSGSWPKRQEISIYATGWIARILGFILKAEQY